MTHEEAEAMLSEFMSALLGVELRDVKLARPAEVTIGFMNDEDEFAIALSNALPRDVLRWNIKREIHLQLTFS